MKVLIRSIFLFLALSLTSCDQLQTMVGDLADQPLTTQQIGSGLKQALEIGIGKGSDQLSLKDGYYKSIYKIILPEEALAVTDKLKIIPGFDKVEEIMIEKINRAAEDAAKSAKPIFVSAIKGMTFDDALSILMGEQNAATSFLHNRTNSQLYSEFQPVILNSLNKLGAVDYWEDAVTAYNKIPFVNKVNPRLDDYVTNRALDGLFGMVEKEEKNIRTNITARTTELLRKVFAKQDS